MVSFYKFKEKTYFTKASLYSFGNFVRSFIKCSYPKETNCLQVYYSSVEMY